MISRSPSSNSREAAILRSLNTPFLPCLLAFLFAFVFGWKAFTHFHFDPRGFINAGAYYSDAKTLGQDFPLAKDAGYDGQFYYRLAHNPFTSIQSAYGIKIDNPPYRQQRIFYPFLAWCLSLGQHALLPWILVGINAVAFCAIGWLGGWWAKVLGKHAFWGVLMVLHVGFAVSFLYDLTEILEIACALCGLMFAHRKQWFGAGALLSLAMLSKETALPLALAAAFFCCVQPLLQRKPFEPGVLWLLAPLVTYASTQIILKAVWGIFPITAGGHNVGLPFQTLSSLLFPALQSPRGTVNFMTIELWLYVAFMALVLIQGRRSPLAFYIKAAWALCALLFVSLSIVVLERDIHFTRAFSEVYILGTLLLLTSSLRTRFMLFTFALTLCLLRISNLV